MGAGRATRLFRPTTADAVMRDHSRVPQVIVLSHVVLIGHGPRPLWGFQRSGVSNEAGIPRCDGRSRPPGGGPASV